MSVFFIALILAWGVASYSYCLKFNTPLYIKAKKRAERLSFLEKGLFPEGHNAEALGLMEGKVFGGDKAPGEEVRGLHFLGAFIEVSSYR